MASFAKACVDLSNNLRNFRFNKTPSSLPPPPGSVTSTSPPAGGSNTFPNTNHTSGLNQSEVHSNSTSHSRSTSPPSCQMADSAQASPTTSRGATVAAIKQRLFNQGLKIDLSPKKKKKTRYKDYMRNHFGDETVIVDYLWLKDRFLRNFFLYFSPAELFQLAEVCKRWKSVLCGVKFYNRLQFVFNFKGLAETDSLVQCTSRCNALTARGIDTVILTNMADRHTNDLIATIAPSEQQIHTLKLRCTSLTDRSIERITETMANVSELAIHCCNDLTEVCLWSCLVPNITVLSISDCINISDESIGAISQLLPHLREFNIQAYHVTDTAMTYFSTKQRVTLDTLRITQCMDITNQGVVNLAHALSGLRVLSLSGCSKLADDGVDVVCEKMKQLQFLDLSWCPKITDSGLECVACDLTLLEYLCLDRCPGVTDTGVSYLSTMPSLVTLYLRWCPGVTDAGLIHILSMTNLRNLSLAGCKRISEDGLCALVRHGRFLQLEVTNCRAASPQVKAYLQQNMPECSLLD